MANPNPTKPQMGGRREGAGRPKGSKNINSMASVRKLEELQFDPIEMMVKKYNYIEEQLAHHHSGKTPLGGCAYAQLVATQGTLINNLMMYGYKKIPDKIEQEVTEKKPISILLTNNKEKDDE